MNREIGVLIVEDEPPISRFVKRIVEEMSGFGKVRICHSGEEGISLIQEYHPQVLITDIRMPGISGLELIRRARLLNPEMFFIVISGYKMFEYAKEAIELETIAYILKPIDTEELKTVLLSVREMWGKRENRRIKEAIQDAFNRDDEVLWKEFLPDTEIKLLAVYFVEGDREKILKTANEFSNNILYVYYRNWLLFFYSDYDTGPDLDILARRLYLAKGKRKTFSCVLVQHMIVEGESIQAIKDFVRLILPRMLYPGERKSFLVKNQQDSIEEKYTFEESVKRRIKIAVQAGNIEKFKIQYNELFSFWGENPVSEIRIRENMYEIVEQLRRCGMLHLKNTMFVELMEEAIRSADDVFQIRDNIWKYLEDALERIQMDRQGTVKQEQELFAKICQLIEGNLEKNYSLNEICDRFHVSQPYVRKIFKTYANKTCREYTLEMKLETAKAIMKQNPSILVRKVADQIGFDQLYFSTVFGKYTGMTPSQYKNMFLDREKRDEGIQ